MTSAGDLAGALLALGLQALAGAAVWLDRRRAGGAQRLACALTLSGAVLGLFCSIDGLIRGLSGTLTLSGRLPIGALRLGADPLSWAFLLPIFAVPGLSAVFGLGYHARADHPRGRILDSWMAALAASMGLVVLSRGAAPFLLAWEAMEVSGYFVAAGEHGDPGIRRAGWVYLVAAHLSSLCLAALFALLLAHTGTTALSRTAFSALPATAAAAAFLLALAGFGLKAGLFPLHFWLPGAHAGAPSHASAVLSGAMLNVGLYGILRLTALLPAPQPWWGQCLLALGAASAAGGALFGLAQSDLKRSLAYSSMEHMGVAAMAAGLALLGAATGHPGWVALGVAAAVLHCWNHSLFKPLMFFGAGAVQRATGTRSLDRLGGLAGRMPATALAMAVGAGAAAALPPLNGFVGEWLLYLGGTRALTGSPTMPLAVPLALAALAFTGALALAGAVRIQAAVFLGRARTQDAGRATEAPAGLLLPMALAAGGCVALGSAAPLAGPLARVAETWRPGLVAEPLLGTALAWTSPAAAALVLLGTALALGSSAWLRRRGLRRGDTWACGYAGGGARAQTTATALSRSLVELFGGVLRVRMEGEPPGRRLWPGPSRIESVAPDIVLEHGMAPLWRRLNRILGHLRSFQRSRVQAYLAAAALTLAVLLLA